MNRVKPIEWLVIAIFFNGVYVLLFPVGQNFVENSTVKTTEILEIGTWIAIGLSLSEIVLPYIFLLLAARGNRGTQRLFRSPLKSLVVGLACSFVPTVYGFALLNLGLSYGGFRLFGLSAVVGMAVWVGFWLTNNRFQPAATPSDS